MENSVHFFMSFAVNKGKPSPFCPVSTAPFINEREKYRKKNDTGKRKKEKFSMKEKKSKSRKKK